MSTSSIMPTNPLYMQTPVNFVKGDFDKWDSDAIIAWGSDKYIYIKESRISSNDGERIDAYVLDQYGEILSYHEGIVEGVTDVSVQDVRISGIAEGNLYFSYQSNVWSGFSQPRVNVSSLDLKSFTSSQIFEHGINSYTGFYDLGDYQLIMLKDGSAYLAASFNGAELSNVIRIQLDSGTFENAFNLDFQVERLLETSAGFAAVGIGHSSYSTGGTADKLHLQFFDNDGFPISDEIYFNSTAYNEYSMAKLSDDNVAFAYSDSWGKFVKVSIFSKDGAQLIKEVQIIGLVAKSPQLFSTSDGGFVLSFLYSDGEVGQGSYYREQVFVRFDALGSRIGNSFTAVTGGLYETSTLAVDQDGGVIGVLVGESGIKSAVFLAQMFGSTAADEIFGTEDVNTIFSFEGDDLVHSLAGNDYIDAGSGKNTIDAGSGNDQIRLSKGANLIDGGSGSDWLIFGDNLPIQLDLSIQASQNFGTFSAQISNVENVDAGNSNDILLGSSAANEIWGRDGNDTIMGRDGNDYLLGGEGADKLYGDAGDDRMLGGAGNDSYYVDGTRDRVYETSSTTGSNTTDAGGTDRIYSTISQNMDAYSGVRFVENLTLTGNNSISGTGNGLNNVLIGNSGNNTLDGGAGNDTLQGGAGNDTYVVDAAGDRVFETEPASSAVNAGGIDTVQSSISYLLAANIENLILTSSASISGTGNSLDNVITGNSAANTLNGGNGNDMLIGSTGNDTLIGGVGNDVIFGGDGTDTASYANATEAVMVDLSIAAPQMTGGGGTDTLATVENLIGSRFKDLLTGTGGNNQLDGGAGADSLLGGAGADVLYGGIGNDTLMGGFGTDQLTGGAGTDGFVFNAIKDTAATSGRDVILDFESGDKINLAGIDANSRQSGNQAFSFIGTDMFTALGQLHYISVDGIWLVEGNTIGDTAADFSIEIRNGFVLQASDFVF
jgi:Ca2+-binding RTX toxin-like protein